MAELVAGIGVPHSPHYPAQIAKDAPHETARLFREVKRQAFNAWIEPEREKLKSCMLRLVDRTGVDRLQIATVILTGGTASVPAVASDVAETFPSAAVVKHDLSHAVVRGLALSRSLPYDRKTARATAI